MAGKGIFPTGRRGSFFGYMGVLGVALGVMVLVVALSIVNGLGESIRRPIRATQGDIQLRGLGGEPLREPQEALQAVPPKVLQGHSAFAWGPVMLQLEGQTRFPFAWGVQAQHPNAAIPIQDYLKDSLQPELDSDVLWISSGLAKNFDLHLGDSVDLYTPLMLERLKEDEVLLPRELTVTGIFETGWGQLDRNTIVCSLDFLQDVYDLDAAVHGLALRIQPDVPLQPLVEHINAELEARGLDAEAFLWTDLAYELLGLLATEKRVLLFIMLFIILVAAFSIAVALMLMAVKKTRDIGLLVALGSTRGSIALVFILQGLLLGTLGSFLGLAGALTALHYRQPLAQALAQLLSNPHLMRLYGVQGQIPAEVLLSDVLISLLFSILVCTLAAALPALYAARTAPAQALRLD